MGEFSPICIFHIPLVTKNLFYKKDLNIIKKSQKIPLFIKIFIA